MELSRENFRAYAFIEWNRRKSGVQIYQQLCEQPLPGSPSRATVFRWCSEFDAGRKMLTDLPRSGRPSSSVTDSTIAVVKDLVTSTPKISTRIIAEELDLSKSTVWRILTEHLEMRKVCSTWVPHELTESNKRNRVLCCQRILEFVNGHSPDELLKFWATEDETWALFQQHATKEENKCWQSRLEPRQRTIQPSLTNKKTMILLAFTGDRKFAVETLERNETVDSSRYISFLKNTGEKWRKLRTSPTRLGELWLQHDNARVHKSTETSDFLRRRGVTLIEQSPYSPDLNQCDRWIFKCVKKELRKSRFENAESVREATLRILQAIPDERFSREIERLHRHCESVINSDGDYVTK